MFILSCIANWPDHFTGCLSSENFHLVPQFEQERSGVDKEKKVSVYINTYMISL
jgi:hypothetical protein